MRLAIPLVVLLPLTAGCLGGADGAQVEAFTATYAMPASGRLPAFIATVKFGDIESYVAADGTIAQGYAVKVDYGRNTPQLGRAISMLDSDLNHQRLLWCNGWEPPGGECVHEQYDWVLEGGQWHASPAFGIGMNVALPTGGERNGRDVVTDKRVYEFADGKLAPTSFEWGTGIARRISYASDGRLEALASHPAEPLERVALNGPGLPGADEDLPGVLFSLDKAVSFLRVNNAEAKAMLDQGACLSSFVLFNSANPPNRTVPIWLQDAPEDGILIGLATNTQAKEFDVEYGRRAPFGEPGFLSAAENVGHGLSQPLNCANRPALARLSDMFRLVAGQGGDEARFLYGVWWGADAPVLRLVVDTPRGRITVNAAEGLLETWHVERDEPIDPLD